MPKYIVETQVTVKRQYEVWADNPKDAEEKSCNTEPTYEEDENEETKAITELPQERSPLT